MITPISVAEQSVSVAWAKVFLALMRTSGGQSHPALIIIRPTSDAPLEHLAIRERLDMELRRCGEVTSETVSGTIFPYSMWNPALPRDAEELFSRLFRV